MCQAVSLVLGIYSEKRQGPYLQGAHGLKGEADITQGVAHTEMKW